MARALVVDDSKALRMILSRTMKQLGFETQEAANGREALEALTSGPLKFDLILADWNMPELNGFELLRAVRSKPEFDAVPVVMVTTETEVESMQAALAAGANEYVMKPFTREILVEKLQLAGILSLEF